MLTRYHEKFTDNTDAPIVWEKKVFIWDVTYVRKGTGRMNKDYAICPYPSIVKWFVHKTSDRCLQKSFSAYRFVEPQISQFANFTPCEYM